MVTVFVMFHDGKPDMFMKLNGEYSADLYSFHSPQLSMAGINQEWLIIEDYDTVSTPTLDDVLTFHKGVQIKQAKGQMDKKLKELYADMMKSRAEIASEEQIINDEFWDKRDEIMACTSMDELRDLVDPQPIPEPEPEVPPAN